MDANSRKEPETDAGKIAPPKPEGVWGTILMATPIILSILATVFAGLSSSEMTRSMYYRSLAAQQQSKAGDQWAFFQAKRIRGTSMDMTVELLQSLAHPDTFNPSDVDGVITQTLQLLEKGTAAKGAANGAPPENIAVVAAKLKKTRARAAQLLNDEKTIQNWQYLTGSSLPRVEVRTSQQKDVQDTIDVVVKAINQRQPESATAVAVGKLNPDDIEAATRLAEEEADHFDKACEPVNDALHQMRGVLRELVAAAQPLRKSAADPTEGASSLAQVPEQFDRLNTSFRVAALDFDARRYRQESFFNRRVAELYEVRVRRSGYDSDRHRERSKRFFYSMLIAQLGVTVSSLALARKQRSLLWVLAALAGVTALGFSGYVYLLS